MRAFAAANLVCKLALPNLCRCAARHSLGIGARRQHHAGCATLCSCRSAAACCVPSCMPWWRVQHGAPLRALPLPSSLVPVCVTRSTTAATTGTGTGLRSQVPPYHVAIQRTPHAPRMGSHAQTVGGMRGCAWGVLLARLMCIMPPVLIKGGAARRSQPRSLACTQRTVTLTSVHALSLGVHCAPRHRVRVLWSHGHRSGSCDVPSHVRRSDSHERRLRAYLRVFRCVRVGAHMWFGLLRAAVGPDSLPRSYGGALPLRASVLHEGKVACLPVGHV